MCKKSAKMHYLALQKVFHLRVFVAGMQVTLDTYSHVALGLQEVVAKKFDEYITNSEYRVSVSNQPICREL